MKVCVAKRENRKRLDRLGNLYQSFIFCIRFLKNDKLGKLKKKKSEIITFSFQVVNCKYV